MFFDICRTNIQNVCCLKFNAIFLHIGRRVRDIQIVIVTNFVVVSSVGIKRVDCIILMRFKYVLIIEKRQVCS